MFSIPKQIRNLPWSVDDNFDIFMDWNFSKLMRAEEWEAVHEKTWNSKVIFPLGDGTRNQQLLKCGEKKIVWSEIEMQGIFKSL